MRKLLIGLLSVLIIFGIGAGFSFYQFMQSKAYVPRTVVPQIPDPSETPEWATLLDKYSRICIEDRTAACLIDAALNLHIQIYMQNGAIPHDLTHYNAQAQRHLVDYIVSFGQQNAAAKILPYVDSNKKGTRTRLLFLSGDYQKADKELAAANRAYEEASDYGAVWALINRGDIEKAIEVSKLALSWQHPRSFTSVHSGVCISDYTRYPRSIGHLAHLLALDGDGARAVTIKNLLKDFIKNKYNGRNFDNCYRLAGRRAYLDAAYGIADVYMQRGKKEKALDIYKEVFFFGDELDHKYDKTIKYEIQRQGLQDIANKQGWITIEETDTYRRHTPEKIADDIIPKTEKSWSEELDACSKNKHHRTYGVHISPTEEMLLCYMTPLPMLQQATVFKKLPWPY